jgi:hypothetical protein
MNLVLLGACTADASKDDSSLSAEGTSSTSTTPTSDATGEPTYTYTSGPGRCS